LERGGSSAVGRGRAGSLFLMIQISVLIRKRGFKYYITHLIWNVSDEQPNFKIDPFKQQVLQLCTVKPSGSTADFQAFRKHFLYKKKKRQVKI